MGYAGDEGYSLEEEAIAHLYIIVTRSFKLLGWIETELSFFQQFIKWGKFISTCGS